MSKQLTLFSVPEQPQEGILPVRSFGKPRLNSAVRNQAEFITKTLDDLLPDDHLVRDVWTYVEKLDLSITLGSIQSTEGNVGRPATDPKILLTLWLYATIKGIGSARMIEEYSKEHDAYKWICGGVNVNYHTISDFRTAYEKQLHDLLIQSVAILSKIGVINLEKISQDGMRVRASAGSSSFRKEKSLRDQLELAKKLVEDLEREAKTNPNACKERAKKAQIRAAAEKEKQTKQALKELQEITKKKEKAAERDRKKLTQQDKAKLRASTTDPKARVMKMACAGFRPAYNVQFATTNKGKAIVGVDVINEGHDKNQICQMVQQVARDYQIVPKKWFVDAGYRSKKELEKVREEHTGCKIYMPVPEEISATETEAEKELRARMETPEGKELYKERAATAEYANAQSRNKGMQQFRVRGLEKVKCMSLIYALAHNLMIFLYA